MTYPVSVGRLLELDPTAQDAVIARIPTESRVKLAHLAALGADRAARDLSKYYSLAARLTEDSP